tara:strand:+ start:108 stop:398 length:291 start_codon:yes stop_codon:yes gene_type:complete
MSLGKLRYTILIIFFSTTVFSKTNIFYKNGPRGEASFFTRKNKKLFTYKKIEDGYFITWAEDEKKYVRSFIKRDEIFEDKLYEKEDKDYVLKEERT